MTRLGLQGRSIAFCVLLIVGTVGAVGSAFLWHNHQRSIEDLGKRALVQARFMSYTAEQPLLLKDIEGLRRVCLAAGSGPEVEFAQIMDHGGQPLAEFKRLESFVPDVSVDPRQPIAGPIGRDSVRMDETVDQFLVVVPVWRDNAELDLGVAVEDSQGESETQDERETTADSPIGFVCLTYTFAHVRQGTFQHILYTLGISIIVIVVGVALTIVIIRQLVRPVNSLVATTTAIAEGDLSKRASEQGFGEIAVLAQSFNHMADTLRSYTEGLETQVSERTAALSESEARTRAIVEMAADAIISINERGYVVSFNAAAERIFGYEAAEVIGKDLKMLMPSPHGERHHNYLESYLCTGDAKVIGHGCEAEAVRKDGMIFPVDVAVSEVILSDRRLFTAIIRDITEQKEAKEKLQASEEKYRNLVETSHDLIWSVDLEGRWTFVNQAAKRILGYEPEEMLGRTFEDFLVPELIEENVQAFRQCLEGKVYSRYETIFRHKNGTRVILSLNAIAIRNEYGEALGATGTIENITDRKLAEETHKRLARAVEATADAICVTSKDGRIIQINPAFTCITGYSQDEVVGRTSSILKSGQQSASFYAHMQQVVSAGEVWTGRLINRRKNGDLYHAALTISPIIDARGEITGYVGVQRDVTEDIEREQQLHKSNDMLVETLKRERSALLQLEAAMEQLNAAKEEAIAAAQTKSEFLANMSHEIRTPMTAILGFTETLLDPDISPQQQHDAINTVQRNGEHLLQILNDILDLSKIEAGKLNIEHIAYSPFQLLADVASLMRVRADAKGLPLNVEYVGKIPETIQTDPTRLRQILINLMGNAIKFTEKGCVRLVTRFVSGEGDARTKRPVIQFEVIDTGIGMSEEQVERLFQSFTQADTSMTRKFGGTGLGLTISKRLAEALGGNIEVESTLDAGSTFRLTIACGNMKGVRMTERPEEAATGRFESSKGRSGPSKKISGRILLAEDGPDNQKLISFILRKAGAEVTIAENGKIAFDLAMAARDEGRPFDVILMDMQMPILDGYGATRALRCKQYTGPIVALTAHAMTEDREKCLRAGCDSYARKPIDREQLVAMVKSYLDGGDGSPCDSTDCSSSVRASSQAAPIS